jgi:hypothetical protein
MGEQEQRASVLGDLVNGHPERVAGALGELEAILREPDDHYALAEAVDALGSAWHPHAASLLVSLVDAEHPDAQVRLALAQALPGGSSEEPIRSLAIGVLTRLSADCDAMVRDWACFGLGQLDADGVEARDALAARLHDEHVDTRAEALVALSKTGDPRALAAVIDRFDVIDPDDVGLLDLSAAAELADPRLLASLDRLARTWAGDDDDHAKALAYAMTRCRPDQSGRAGEAERILAHAVNERLGQTGCGRSISLAGTYPRTTLTVVGPDGAPDETFGRHRIWDELTPSDDVLDVEWWASTAAEH